MGEQKNKRSSNINIGANMNTREKRKLTKQRDIDNYEANLKLHYESMQNELNTIIRNTIPRQMTMLRTLMWVNVVFLYLAARTFSNTYSYYLLLISIGIAFAMSLYSMLFGRLILYGNSQKRRFIKRITIVTFFSLFMIGLCFIESSKINKKDISSWHHQLKDRVQVHQEVVGEKEDGYQNQKK